MKRFGIIGFPLGHSFSQKYFTQKYQELGFGDTHVYDKFELPSIVDFKTLMAEKTDLVGLNVTIPYKVSVIPFLDSLDASAQKVGAVNVIKKMENGHLRGYNSDYYGFLTSLKNWLKVQPKALILGNGGAAKAVQAALSDLDIAYKTVVRTKTHQEQLLFSELDKDLIEQHLLVINTTPQGTYPQVFDCPAIPYHYLTANHWLYDLVYNPENTQFMQNGIACGAQVHNGLQMLHLQAEKAWDIWNEA